MTDSNNTTNAFRKGQKVWLVRMDRTGLYQVTPGIFVRTENEGRVLMVRIPLDPDPDLPDRDRHMVVDHNPKEVCRSRKEAALTAAARSREVARRHTERADELLASLASQK
jgi:hypothetical protein